MPTLENIRTGQVPTWLAVVSVLVAGALAFWIGTWVGDEESSPASVQQGTVFSVDDGEICIEQNDMVECYRAAGAGATVGQDVRFVVTKTPIDPGQDHGTILTLVFLAEEE